MWSNPITKPPQDRQLCWFVPFGELQPSIGIFIGTFYGRKASDKAMDGYIGYFQNTSATGGAFNVSSDTTFNMVEKWQPVIVPEV